MYERLNVLDWLNSYYNNSTNFSDEKINAVRDFSLLWNLFESKLGKRHINIQILSNIAYSIYRSCNQQDFYTPYLQYFQRRYLNEGNNVNQLFLQLVFRPNDRKELVESVLKQTERNPVKIIEAILIIIYRLRNNMFHGEKELHNIHTQYDNFNNANRFLAELLMLNKIAT